MSTPPLPHSPPTSSSSSSFTFSSFPRAHPVDWNLLERVPSPEDIVRFNDVDGLELIVEDVIRGNFSPQDEGFDDDDDDDDDHRDNNKENKKKTKLKEKAFQLAQLLVEYLLFVQDVLIERKTASQNENDKLKTELEVWVRRAKEEREKRKALQNTTKKEDEDHERKTERAEAAGMVEELKVKLRETTTALERARAELEEFKKRQQKATTSGNGDKRGNTKSGKENSSLATDGRKNNGSDNIGAAGIDRMQYSGKLTQEVKNLLVRVGAKSGGKLSDRNTARSFGKLKEIIEAESNSSDRSAAERRKYQETSRNLHLTLVNGESFQAI
jgi:hypothetical protein